MSELLPDALPEGVRLVHIGPHKTGTTAVQYGFHRRREQVASYGVHYAGPDPQVYRQAVALTGLPGRLGASPARPEEWTELVEEVRAAGEDRVVISSESFSNAEPAHIRRLVADLDPERIHVVRMVRRYDKLVPSQWQQQIAAGRTRTYDSFLEQVVRDTGSRFWERHGFATLTRTWADVVGADRVSVVVVDESDRDWLLRVFESLVALPEGVLDRLEEDPAAGEVNRSLTAGEVEMLRYLNQFRGQSGWTPQTHQHLVRRGISPALRSAPRDPHGERIELPASLQPFLAERTAADLASLRELGVRVIGDPAWLDVPEPRAVTTTDSRPSLPLSSVVAAAESVVRRRRQMKRFTLAAEDLPAAQVPPLARKSPAGDDARPEALPGTAAVDVVAAHPDVAPDAEDLVALGDAQRRLVTGFSAVDPTWVIVTLLPWDAALLASWQSHLLAGGVATLEEWQESWVAAGGPAEAETLVRAAQGRVGADHVRGVVVDPRRAGSLGRTLAAALGAAPAAPSPAQGRRVLTHAELAFLRDLSARLGAEERMRFLPGAFAWMAAGNAPSHGVPVTDATRAALEQADAALVATGVPLSTGRGLGRLRTDVPDLRLTPMAAARAVGGVMSRTDDRTH